MFLENHIKHFNQILNLLKINKITLLFIKCHFAYLSIIVFNYYIFKLNLNIIKEKIKIIRKITFLRNL